MLLTQSQPGHRFEERYWRKRHAEHSALRRLAWIVSGVLLLVVGLFFTVFPGPGILFLLAGLACLAQESLAVARALDRLEVALRRLLPRIL
jgi:putative transmembrane protein PGPGW